MGEWIEAIGNPWVIIVLLTFVPGLELRASIPYGILVAKLPWLAVVGAACLANVLIGPMTYFALERFLHLLLRIRLVDWLWQQMIVRTQKKLQPVIARHGVWGLSVFIGIPLPGTGVYSGAVGGYLLGLNRRQVYIASAAGVLIAAAIVTAVVLTGSEIFSFLINPPAAS